MTPRERKRPEPLTDVNHPTQLRTQHLFSFTDLCSAGLLVIFSVCVFYSSSVNVNMTRGTAGHVTGSTFCVYQGLTHFTLSLSL